MKLRLLFSMLLCFMMFASYGQISSVGLIGSATPGGWDVDTNMVQDMDSANLWTLTIDLVPGAAKFRADDDWAVNWGAADFPAGIGTQDGPDIPVPFAGTYNITFNSNTGEYFFDIDSDISIIGSATPGGWEMDTKMYPDTLENGFVVELDLVVGEAKFRKDMDWAVNWGSADFPSGVGVQDGDNIPVDKAGSYRITFDTVTGAYNFEEVITFATIGIIGDATPGGWDVDTDLTQDANDPNLWTGNIDLTNGEIKFRANDDWAISWGGPAEFPMDTAILGSNDNIAVDSGTYLVNFNTETGIFSFLPIVYYETVGIIGDATPGGWDADTDMERSETDSAVWSLRIILTDGEAKFRADDDWAVNWGAGDFPSGVATQDGANIPITAGEYIITFNTTTGEYNFEELVIFNTVGIIGTGTPLANWDEDIDMTKDAVDEQLWTLDEITLSDGEVKFRAEDDWAVNWGPEDNTDAFPSGVGVQDGANILSQAGNWRVTLRSDDGSYSFDVPSDTQEPILKTAKIYPNPAQSLLNIELNTENIRGNINIELYDLSGKRVLYNQQAAVPTLSLDVSELAAGNYFVRVFNDSFVLAKPVSIVR